jgi:hypothetical protein
LKYFQIFELILSLQYLDENAPWEVIGFQITVCNHITEKHNNENSYYDISTFEKSVFDILREKSLGINNLKILFQSLENKLASNDDSDIQQQTILMDSTTELTEVTVTPSLIPMNCFTLEKVFKLCQQASDAVIQRILFVQAAKMSKSMLWKGGYLEVDFLDSQIEQCVLKIAFGKCTMTR